MKNSFLIFALLFGTSVAQARSINLSYELLELDKLPKGSSIEFKKTLFIEPGAESEYITTNCEMKFETSNVTRKFTFDHKLVLFKVKTEVKQEDTWWCGEYLKREYAKDWVLFPPTEECGYVDTSVTYYTLIFDIVKKGMPSKTSPIRVVCKDEKEEKIRIRDFKYDLNTRENLKLKVKDDAADF